MEDFMSSAVHISLNASDLRRSTEFYRRFLGEPAKLQPDYVKFVAEEPGIHLALQPGEVRGPGALSHLGIRLDSPEEVGRWKAALQGRGLETGEESRETCCYALQEKFWVTDPDGNRWEIYTVLEDTDRKSDPAMACCRPGAGAAAACC
jgi:catechol 2,3-dioxygenase-like lactoylglutathione lyase family enzyme